MKFRKVFNGYDPTEVDNYIKDISAKDAQICAEQKERIDSLLEENDELRLQVEEYRNAEQAMSKTLVESAKLAQELKYDAEKFSEVVLSRAKIFYAAWHTYAETLVNTLSPEELKEFSAIEQKIGEMITDFEGGKEQEVVATTSDGTQQQVVDEVASRPSEKTMGTYVNPIGKVEEVANTKIDMQEILRPKDSLEDICKALGIIGGNKNN